MIPRRRAILSSALAIVFLPVALGAADFTVYVGGLNPGTLTRDNLRQALDGSPIWGFRLSTGFLPLVKFEHSLGFSSDFLFPRNLSAIEDAKGFVYNSNLLLNLPVRRSVPYLTAGIGLLHQYGAPDLPVGTRFAINYGGGLKFPRMLGPMGLRFDARGYTATGISTANLNIFELTAGLLFSF